MAPLDKSTSEADVIFELMEKDCKIGRRCLNEGVIGKMLELDDDESQDMMRRLRSSNPGVCWADPKQALAGLERLLHKRTQGTKTLQAEAARQ